MTKRKLNKQQRTRIEQSQAEALHLHTDSPHHKGLVLCCFGKRALIEDEKGHPVDCAIRPNLPTLVAGDHIVWQAQEEHTGVVISLFPRQSILERLDKQGQPKPTAANVSQMIIVIAPKPTPSWPLLDTYLIAAETLHLQACIVLNKIDLPVDALKTLLHTHYAALPYPILFTTQQDPSTYETLKQQLATHTSVFVGQSGVGKSSLIQALLPHQLDIQIGEISEAKAIGRHTTSVARFYHLPSGGALIDSPGVRSFQLPLNHARILAGYPEFRGLLQHCRFRNCNHQNTPGCAILNALAEKRVSTFRYDNFLQILKNLDVP